MPDLIKSIITVPNAALPKKGQCRLTLASISTSARTAEAS